ncbi:hypothetical protein EX895_003508 [Sporisorium graminicola]|uniref:HMG box domain-containing protein n=1 Tax=Sporisorium graminicola TaxID=280036 RepID=A0A4U7KSL3_9BASI|nr:hypothetical protein EX895_003508 [Sporisorium graminicola]TKY87494.1 hypothetical protein EX895_003508 [Sporisorium graminicola]
MPGNMAQPGSGSGPGPPRTTQWDDRGTGQHRPESDGAALISSQSDAFGRPASYVDGSSLFPSASSASYAAASGGGVRADAFPNPLLGQSNHPTHDPQPHAHDHSTFLHHASHYSPYSQPLSVMSHASQQPHQQHQDHEHHHHQHSLQLPPPPPLHHQNYQQHQHQQHQHPLQHTPDQELGGLQMPSELMGSQSLEMQHPHSPYAPHHHLDGHQSPVPAQHRALGRAEGAAEPHTPRPPNAWILYRSQKFREIQQTREALTRSGSTEKSKSQAEISRIISQMWQNETAAIKGKFEALADEKKMAHQKMYPTYRYRPKKNSKRKQGAVAAAQKNDLKQKSNGPASKKAAYGSHVGGSRVFEASEGNSSTRNSSERTGGYESQRSPPSRHDPAGREREPTYRRAAGYVERKERGEFQMPITYVRSVSGSTPSSDGPTFPYNNTSMHPYGERPMSRPDAFGDSQTNPSTYGSSSHWSEADALSGSSGGGYFEAARSASTGYTMFGNPRPPPSSMLGPGSVGGAPSLLTLSPSSQEHQQQQQPPSERQLVPSQHLVAPIGYLEGGLGLNGLSSSGASGHFRARGPSSYGELRSEMVSGLTMPGGDSERGSEPLDVHRCLQLP